ncbi:MAG: alpha/beta fold hydrolase [Candidatus Hodarchaeota archaeon]
MNEKNEMNWEDGSVQANGIKIHYLRTGGNKPQVLMLHGLGDNGACWSRVAMALEKDYDVIMIDQRGHGKTMVEKTDFSFELLADDAAGVISNLGLEKPAVIGHSMGGQATTVLAAKYPNLVSKIILEDPAYFINFFIILLVKLFLPLSLRNARKDGKKTIDELRERCKKNDPNWVEEDVEPWAISKKQYGENLEKITLGKVKSTPNWKKIFPKVQCPALMIIPPSSIHSPRQARKIIRLFNNGKIEFIKDSGHSVRRDQFLKYVETIKQFL